MNRVMVRYRVKPEPAARNAELGQDVYTELHNTKPAGLRYATFSLDDGVSFVHIAENDTTHEASPLEDAAAFHRFLDGTADRCDEQPVVTEIRGIRSYLVFEETSP